MHGNLDETFRCVSCSFDETDGTVARWWNRGGMESGIKPSARAWQVDGLPRAWSRQYVCDFLELLGYRAPRMGTVAWEEKMAVWTFDAVQPDGIGDVVEVRFATGGRTTVSPIGGVKRAREAEAVERGDDAAPPKEEKAY